MVQTIRDNDRIPAVAMNWVAQIENKNTVALLLQKRERSFVKFRLWIGGDKRLSARKYSRRAGMPIRRVFFDPVEPIFSSPRSLYTTLLRYITMYYA